MIGAALAYHPWLTKLSLVKHRVLLSLCKHNAGFVGEGFTFPRRLATLVADGLSCIPGALMGTSPLIITVESSVGIEEGGRTGLAAFFTGCFFLLAMFFAPLLSAIPPYATGKLTFYCNEMAAICSTEWQPATWQRDM